MTHICTCKFCGKQLAITVADEYVGDRFNLLKLAACNRCADLRVTKRILEERIKKACLYYSQYKLARYGREVDPAVATFTEKLLVDSTQKYAEWFGEYANIVGYLWDMELVRLLMDNPAEWNQTLITYCDIFRRQSRRPEL